MSANCEEVRTALMTASTAELLSDDGLRAHLASCAECRGSSQLIVATEHALASTLEAETAARPIEPVLAVVRYAARIRMPDARREIWVSRARMAGVALLWLVGGALVLTSIILSILQRTSHR